MHKFPKTFLRRTRSLLSILVIALMASCFILASENSVLAQPTSRVNVGFGAVSPFVPAASANNYLTNAYWSKSQIILPGTNPNSDDFFWVPAAGSSLPAVTDHNAFPGTNVLRYNNAAAGSAGTGAEAILISPSLDFTGRPAGFNAGDTASFWFWRDNTGGAIGDSIQVYINTSPTLTGATLLIERVTGATGLNRSNGLTPVSAAGWQCYSYNMPTTATYAGPGTATTTAYIIIRAISRGGNNMYFDDFSLPEWATNMVIQSAVIFQQTNLPVNKGSLDNPIMGIQITTRGSLVPDSIDEVSFSSSGSTNFAADVSASKCWYTGANSTFATVNGPVQIPNVGATNPAAVSGLLNFGYTTVCGPIASGRLTKLSPGTENYIWLAYDIAAGATSNDVVAADFYFMYRSKFPYGATCTFYGLTSTTTYGATPIAIQTNGNTRPINVVYSVPTYSAGCSYAGYNANDYCSAVDMIGDNGTNILNYFHDGNPASYCPSCLATAAQPAHCTRLGCHPPDYTLFPPVQGPLPNNAYKYRKVQLTVGTGLRSGGVSTGYLLRAQAGEWPYSNNNIAVFIDWNADGDFSDTYTGPGGILSENYGTHSMLNGDLNTFPVGSWPLNTSWTIDVPLPTDAVTNVGGVGGPVFLGNVRMRIREVYAVNPIDPFSSNYTWGEVEDYTIQVLPNCPPFASNVKQWIGGTSDDWNDPSNWCPGIPGISDMAYIPIVSAPYLPPTIKDNTTAVCRQLKIVSGAVVNIDATKSSSLTVADDVIIGFNASGGTTSYINVNSNFTKTQNIPGNSSAPPAGVALLNQTPFRTNAQAKTQIAYTAAELGTTYGWKLGDVIDQISIEVATVGGGVGSTTFQKFRIRAFLTTAPVTFPLFPASNVKVAVETGDNTLTGWPVSVWPKTIFPVSNPDTTLAFVAANFPMAVSGTKAGGNYYTFNLKANTLVWDGVSNLVLSFENWTPVGFGAPAKALSLYDEPNGTYNVLSLNYTSPHATITGQTIDGNQHYPGGFNASIGFAVSNQRPRLEFHLTRPYLQFPITVGGSWYNNNRGTFAPSTVIGSAGFHAGNSSVKFDNVAGQRSSVSSPGLASTNFWNTAAQPVGPLADVDQLITSQINAGATASTVFNSLIIDENSATGKVVRQASTVVSLIGSFADTLYLTKGELDLNRKEFTLQKSVPTALVQSGFGWLRSEDNGGALPGTIESKFTWKIGLINGIYQIPFKNTTTSTALFNLKYTKVSGDVGDLTVGTYGTPTQFNTPYPYPPLPVGNPLHVVTMTTNPSPIVDATPWTVDRFWYVKRSTASLLPAGSTLTFEYDNNVEGTTLAAYVGGEMKAQRYEISGASPGWHAPYAGQNDGIGAGFIRFVNHPAEYIDNTYNIWAVVHTNLLQAPLPLSITNFSGRQVNDRVKLWWNVQSEANITKYSIERTVNQSFYELIANRSPVGPSNSTLTYEAWDNKPLKGTQYYRLASETTDGSVKYYGPVSVTFGTPGLFDITNLMATTNASIKVDFNYDSNLPYTYMVIDMLGNVVAQGVSHHAAAGENSIVIPVQLARGIYAISLSNSEKTVSQKLVY